MQKNARGSKIKLETIDILLYTNRLQKKNYEGLFI
jgi:hypothetical protein